MHPALLKIQQEERDRIIHGRAFITATQMLLLIWLGQPQAMLAVVAVFLVSIVNMRITPVVWFIAGTGIVYALYPASILYFLFSYLVGITSITVLLLLWAVVSGKK